MYLRNNIHGPVYKFVIIYVFSRLFYRSLTKQILILN